MEQIALFGFGPSGWGGALSAAALVTVTLTCSAFALALVLGSLFASLQLSGHRLRVALAKLYIVIFRGAPDILVIYLMYFGGNQLLKSLSEALGLGLTLEMNSYLAGVIAIGLVSGASLCEVLRGGYQALPKGAIEAAVVCGMPKRKTFTRIIVPMILRDVLPSLSNQWQIAIKSTAVVSAIGLVEVMRQVAIASGSTRQYLLFACAGALIFLLLSAVSEMVFRLAERRFARSTRNAKVI